MLYHATAGRPWEDIDARRGRRPPRCCRRWSPESNVLPPPPQHQFEQAGTRLLRCTDPQTLGDSERRQTFGAMMGKVAGAQPRRPPRNPRPVRVVEARQPNRRQRRRVRLRSLAILGSVKPDGPLANRRVPEETMFAQPPELAWPRFGSQQEAALRPFPGQARNGGLTPLFRNRVALGVEML